MTDKEIQSAPAEELRRKAEDHIWKTDFAFPPGLDALSYEQIQQMLHELRVHQVELKMQNEELRQSQEKLAAARDRYYNFCERAPVGFFTVNEKGLVLEVNLTAADFLDVDRFLVVRQPITMFILDEDQDIYYLHRKKLFKTGEPQACDLRMVKKDGTIFWANLQSSVAQEFDDGPVYCVVLSDITNRKRMEQKLVQSKKMESVGRLAGGIAHDFNNQLAVILGYIETILDQVDPTQSIHDDLIDIQMAARSSADLVRQLLAFAKKQPIIPKVIDLNAMVEGNLNMLRRLIGENIDIVTHLEVGLWPIHINPSQVDQVLTNLCINARDAIPGVGKIIIEASNTFLDDAYCTDHEGLVPGDYVVLAVSDDGHGMDKATIKNIFEPFFTTKDVGQGTGLGLATVYGVVKQNNGFITVDSEPGKGSTFRIYLPRHTDKAAQPITQSPSKSITGGHETIMLVDDDPSILKMTGKILKGLGYTVIATNVPMEAIRLAQERAGQIHLLLTDVIMPKINGQDLAKSLQTLYPELKCLFMSGYTADVIIQDGMLGKENHFIHKPFSKTALAAKVRDALQQS